MQNFERVKRGAYLARAVGGRGRLRWPRPRRWVVVCAVCVAFLAGVGYARHAEFTSVTVPRALWLSVPLLLVTWRRQAWLAAAMIMLVAAQLGFWRGALYAQKLRVYDGLWNQKVTVVGRATEDAVYGSHYQLTFEISQAQVVLPFRAPLVGVLQVGGFGASSVYKGDVVQVSGTLQPALGNDQAEIGFGELVVRSMPHSRVDMVRQKFTAGVQSALPEPLASFGMGLLIGQRNTLPKDVSQMLLMVGLTHIIAVSGYNLTIIIEVARRLLAKRSKFQMAASCGLLLGLFLAITGTSASVVRAALISAMSLLAWYFGRQVRPLVLLLVAAVATVAANPLYLWGNISWWLSFLAFFGVVVLGPMATRRLYGERQPRLIGQIVVESFCAEIMTLPYVLHVFGQFSFVAILANVFIAAWVPLAMLLTLVAGVAGALVSPLAGWLAFPAAKLLAYMLDMSAVLSRIPHVFVQNLGFSFLQMCEAYGVVGLWMFVLWSKTTARKYATLTDRKKLAALHTKGAIP